MNLLKPGAYARDTVTGFEGVITALCQELGKPDQLRCQFRIESESRDGKPGENQWFDVSRVEAARKGKAQSHITQLPESEAEPADTAPAEARRLPLALIGMLMSMGIAKVIRGEDCDCPSCTAEREAKKTH